MSEKEKYIWIAGLLEGEGSFVIHYRNNRPNPLVGIVCEMTDEDIIRNLHLYTGKGSVTQRHRSNKKPSWIWKIMKKDDVYNILTNIFPYMGTRRSMKIKEQLSLCQKYM